MKKLTISLAVGAMLLTGGVTTATAQQAPTKFTATVTSKNSSTLQQKYTEKEVLQLLFDGSGIVAEENPELLARMKFAENRPETDMDKLNEVIDAYLKYHPNFDKEVLRPLTSGNPQQVEKALLTLNNKYFQMLEEKYGVAASDINVSTEGTALGCGVAKVCVAVYAVAVANAGIYANVAVATFAVATLAVVPAAVSYLMDPDSTDGELVKTEFIADLTKALANPR